MTNGDSPERLVKAIHQIGVEEFEHVVNDHSELWRHYEVTSHPTLVFVEPGGSYTSVVGGQTINKIAELTEQLLKAS